MLLAQTLSTLHFSVELSLSAPAVKAALHRGRAVLQRLSEGSPPSRPQRSPSPSPALLH